MKKVWLFFLISILNMGFNAFMIQADYEHYVGRSKHYTAHSRFILPKPLPELA